jgi:hypothetical protein
MSAEHLIPGGGRKARTPDSLRHLHVSVIGRALVEADGHVGKAAEKLKVPFRDLLRMTRFRRELVELIDELFNRAVYDAQRQLRQAIRDRSNPERALRPSIWLLGHSEFARELGYCPPSSPPANVTVGVAVPVPTRYFWADGTELTPRHSPPAIPEAAEPPADETPPE